MRLPLTLGVVLAALMPSLPSHATYQFFAYQNAEGRSRMCRGDVDSGDAICTNGTAVAAEVPDDAEPKWQTDASSCDYLMYPSPFEGPGNFGFFTYKNNAGLSRVCVGDTRSGEVRCADGTAWAATATGTAKPKWDPDPKVTITVLRYFPAAKAGKAGTYGFGSYYSTDGQVRICNLAVATGIAVCVGGTSTTAQRTGGGKIGAWQVDKGIVVAHRQFFGGL